MTKPNLKLVTEPTAGPSLAFIMRGRNPFLDPPKRYEPTRKRPGDIVIGARPNQLGEQP
jgi:hypothetical protein